MPQKTLIICEKPSVAEAIARTLAPMRRQSRYYEGGEYIVTWSYGHLIELCDAGDYDSRFRRWNFASLPIIPEQFKLKLRPGKDSTPQFKVIKELIARADVSQLVNACDSGREGELIFRNLYRAVAIPKPCKRLWLSSVVEEAILKAFAQMEDSTAYDNLAAAAEARSECDWLVGINATRAFTVKNKSLLHLGRVLTPTLALLVRREEEIALFRPQDYWEIFAHFVSREITYTGKWFSGDKNRLFNSETAVAVSQKVSGRPAAASRVKTKEAKQHPPLLYNLTDLQKDANRRFRFTASKTLSIAQKLYDEKKLITYPRTDSNYLTREVYAEADKIFAGLATPIYASLIRNITVGRTPPPRLINAKKVGDHHAIIPTGRFPDEVVLTLAEKKIFDLIARRFIAVFYPPAQFRETEVITTANEETFLSRSRPLISAGWLAVYAKEVSDEKDDTGNPDLSGLTEGHTSVVEDVKIEALRTTPPSRFTEGTLLAAMETAGKLVENAALKEALKEKGIGTVASRPQIIEKLKSARYLETEGIYLRPTVKGITLINTVTVDSLKSPELTGEWEKRLRDIETGRERKDDLLADVKAFTENIVESVINGKPIAASSLRITFGRCPLCGAEIIENRKAYACSRWRDGCQFTVWKEIAGKKISAKTAQLLTEKRSTGVLRGFKNKDGKTFSARLAIENGKVVFRFGRSSPKKKA